MQAPVHEVEATQIIVLLTAIAIVAFSFAMHTLLSIPRLAFTVRQPSPGHGRAG